MVEIYKVIAYYKPLFNQIFDDGNVKGANNNQVCKRGIWNLLAFFGVEAIKVICNFYVLQMLYILKLLKKLCIV